jgi:hypothetical protein
MRNPVGMHEAGLSKFTHYLRGKLSAASKENLKQALDTPPGDKGGTDLWTLRKISCLDPEMNTSIAVPRYVLEAIFI